MSRQSRRLAKAIGDDYATVALQLQSQVEENKKRIKISSTKVLYFMYSVRFLTNSLYENTASVRITNTLQQNLVDKLRCFVYSVRFLTNSLYENTASARITNTLQQNLVDNSFIICAFAHNIKKSNRSVCSFLVYLLILFICYSLSALL